MKKSLLTLTILSALTVSSLASANQAGDILIRGGATMVDPDSDKTGIDLNGADSGMSLSVDDNTQLGLNFVYFYDSNWAIELLAATPFKHDITVHDPSGVLGVDGVHLAEVTQLPPTLSALYYFDTSSKLKPYVGLGINYTIFFDEGFEDAPKSLGFSDLELDASVGYSVQIGADYHFDDQWSINASARYIDINTDASFKYNDTVKGSADVDVDPMVYSLMIGYKF